jgi:3-deoxy-D-manno-octulosonate 8-phosphate phosphatase (KDO 8-P phosphatase)
VLEAAPSPTLPADLVERLRPVRLLALDVDGVLTDGNLYWTDAGGWSQRFSVRDGFGIKLLQERGFEVAILSGGDLRAGRERAASLGIRRAYFGVADKVARFRELVEETRIAPRETAYVGDEIVDVPVIQLVGFGATVPEAVDEVRAAAHYVTRRPGGDGAVREVCDLLRTHADLARRP